MSVPYPEVGPPRLAHLQIPPLQTQSAMNGLEKSSLSAAHQREYADVATRCCVWAQRQPSPAEHPPNGLTTPHRATRRPTMSRLAMGTWAPRRARRGDSVRVPRRPHTKDWRTTRTAATSAPQ